MTPTHTAAATSTPTLTRTATSTITPTGTPTQLPVPTSPPDEYEDDDTCEDAVPLPPNGLAQDHTFHRAGDPDWVRFNAITGTRYVIAGTHTGGMADVNLELYDQCAGSPVQTSNDFGRDTFLIWAAPVSGRYYVRATNLPPAAFGDQTGYRLSIRSVTTGAAIIVGGRLRTAEYFQPQITFMTNHAYRVFNQAGYEHDAIYYLSADPIPPPRVDGPSSAANLAYAITAWAPQHVSDGAPLFVYLTDHGEPERFYANTSTEVITPEQLDAWLFSFQGQRPNSPVVIIIEACKSGSFITPPRALSRTGRLIVTATGDDNDSYAHDAGLGGGLFSDPFFDALAGNYDLWTSYTRAAQAVHAAQGTQQTPWIDGNGNGLPYPLDPGDEGAGRSLGLGRAPGSFAGQAPYVETPAIVPPGSSQPLRIRVKVLDEDLAATTAWMDVTKPSTPPPSPPPGYVTPISHAERIALTYNPATDRFEADFVFDEGGRYEFVFQAEDAGGLRSQGVAVNVAVGRAFLPWLGR